MSERIVAIHQPNFFPWLGYFDKLARADVFVLLDDVQFPKKGGTWINRVKLAVNGEPAWVTMPVDRAYHGVRAINEMRIDDGSPWRAKLLKTLAQNYGKAAHYEEVRPLLEELVMQPGDQVAAYNTRAILKLGDLLGCKATAKACRASELAVEGVATDLLIAIVRAVGGTTYMCGGGAGGYQEDEKFAAAGIRLLYQDFRHPTYPQVGPTFASGLSVIDALANVGPAGVSEMLAAWAR